MNKYGYDKIPWARLGYAGRKKAIRRYHASYKPEPDPKLATNSKINSAATGPFAALFVVPAPHTELQRRHLAEKIEAKRIQDKAIKRFRNSNSVQCPNCAIINPATSLLCRKCECILPDIRRVLDGP